MTVEENLLTTAYFGAITGRFRACALTGRAGSIVTAALELVGMAGLAPAACGATDRASAQDC
jgi:hypothetical protein